MTKRKQDPEGGDPAGLAPITVAFVGDVDPEIEVIGLGKFEQGKARTFVEPDQVEIARHLVDTNPQFKEATE